MMQFHKIQYQQDCGETGSLSFGENENGSLPFRDGNVAICIKILNLQPFQLVY